MPKRPPKTPKEKKFVKLLALTGDPTLAAEKSYDVKDRHSASSIAGQNLKKLAGMDEILEKHNVTDDYLAEKIKEGLEANRVISAVNTDKLANGATTDFIEVPDHLVRHKYLETTLKLKNKYPKNETGVQLKDGDKTISIIVRDYE
jgi:hypothetical protein